jgi:hypothetical protein
MQKQKPLTGLGDTVPYQMQRATQNKIYQSNVPGYGDGRMGAANGMGLFRGRTRLAQFDPPTRRDPLLL